MNGLERPELGGLPLPSNARTWSVCPGNPSGGKVKGGMAVPDLANRGQVSIEGIKGRASRSGWFPVEKGARDE